MMTWFKRTGIAAAALAVLMGLAGISGNPRSACAATARSVEADFNGQQMPADMVGPHTWWAKQTFSGQLLVTAPAAQTIGAGGTITADACGTIKQITAAGAVTTDTTNSFTAPSATLSGCCMTVFNSGGTNTITIDGNTLTVVAGAAANLAVTAYDAVNFCCDGTTWRQTTALLSNN